MTPQQLRRALYALLGAAALWVVLLLVRRPPQDRHVSLAIPKVDTSAVDGVILIEGNDSTVIARQRGTPARWTTDGFAADTTMIRRFLAGLADGTLSTELMGQSPAMHGEFGVANDARRVQVFVGGQRTIDLIVGGRTVDYVGLFVRRAGDDTVYALRGDLAEPLRRPKEDWRDKRIVSVNADSVATIEIRHGRQTVVARRDGPASGSWTLSNGRPADRAKVDLMLREYAPLMAAGFASPDQARALDFTSPKARTRFVSHGGRVLAEIVFDSTDMAMWARTADGVEIFRVNPWMWSRLVPAL